MWKALTGIRSVASMSNTLARVAAPWPGSVSKTVCQSGRASEATWMVAAIGQEEEPLSLALEVKAQVARRVPVRRHSPDARRHLLARLEEAGPVGKRHDIVAEQGREAFQCAGMAARARPEIVLDLADGIARVREEAAPILEQASDVVGVPMRQDDEVDRLGRKAGRREHVDEPAAIGPRHEALRPVPGVEQDQLLSRVDHHRGEARLVLVRGQEVVAHEPIHFGLR